MLIKAYYNVSDSRQINKDIREETEFDGEFRDEADIMNPTIRFQSADIMRFNYFYIPDFRRYYHVKSITAVSDTVYDIEMAEDVLMSFRGDIVQLTAIIDRQAETENSDEYIDNSMLVTDNNVFHTVVNFPNGFNQEPSYILITAG